MKRFLELGLALTLALGSLGFGVGCKEDDVDGAVQEVTVYMPDGAPAMGFASLMKSDVDTDGVTYKVVSPALIATKVSAKEEKENADICALPITAASKLLGNGEKYRMLGVLTSGNLFVLSKDEQTLAAFETQTDLSHLVGKKVGVMKMNEVPGLTFKCILEAQGLAWQEYKNGDTLALDKVNLKAISDATEIDVLDTSVGCYVVAEPAASVQIKRNGFEIAASVNDLYNRVQSAEGLDGYPQAVLMAKTSLIETRKAWLDGFLEQVADSAVDLANMNGEEIVETVVAHLEDSSYKTTLKGEVLSQETVERCGVGFVVSGVCKQSVVGYLEKVTAVDSAAAKIVQEKFFY